VSWYQIRIAKRLFEDCRYL